jgi:hypothetical protein
VKRGPSSSPHKYRKTYKTWHRKTTALHIENPPRKRFVYAPNNRTYKKREGKRKRKRSFRVDVAVVHQLGGCVVESVASVCVLKTSASIVKENLLGCHVVVVGNCYID